GEGVGFPMRRIDNLLMALIVMAVILGLQAVGVVLMAAMLITPAVAARYWTERLDVMVLLSALFGGLSGAAGAVVSALGPRLPTGPLIVLAATSIFLISLVAAPRRGLVAKTLRYLGTRRKVARENLLRDVYEQYELSFDGTDAASNALLAQGIELDRVIGGPSSPGRRSRLRVAQALAKEGLLRLELTGETWICSLTPRGLQAAWDVVRRHRLWEMYLTHKADLKADHVDRDADDIEHFLTPDLVARLERLLEEHHQGPRIWPSVHPLDEPKG